MRMIKTTVWTVVLLLVFMAVCPALARAEETPESAAVQPEFREFSDLSGKKASMLNGAPFEELIRSKVPDIGPFSYYNNMADMCLALRSGKTDAILSNNAVGQLSVNRDPELVIFPQNLEDRTFGIAFAKGSPQREVWQKAFDTIPEETVQAAWTKWTGADETVKILPKQDWPGANGTVKASVCDTLEPMSYAGPDGKPMGFDIEILLLIARELDVHVEFTGKEFSAILSDVQAGKALLGAGSIIATDERKEAVDFVEYYPASFVLLVRAAETQDSRDLSFWDSVASSFTKTFIRENRWKMFLTGVLNTLLITVLSILLGTALGFAVFMACRKGGRAANGITRGALWLVQGMPMVVLLMVLYYLVFGSISIGGLPVAVIGFSLTFGASVLGLLKIGVGAVDPGQYEAAYALGYSDRRAFFRIILPQALPHVMTAYRGEIVGLIKATAIVGYIAVQDLTKVGDLIRSRTLEAFFPLIAVTVIYFGLEALFIALVKRLEIRINPRERKKEKILKGIRTETNA